MISQTIPNRKSEDVERWKNKNKNTMAIRKRTKYNQWSTKQYTKKQRLNNTNPTNNRAELVKLMVISDDRTFSNVYCHGNNISDKLDDDECHIGRRNFNPSGVQEFSSGVSWFRVARTLVFCVVICRSLCVLSL